LTEDNLGIYKHNYNGAMGSFYGTVYPFEVEPIHNAENKVDKLFYNLSWKILTEKYDSGTRRKEMHAGFTSVIAYNEESCSGEIPLEYLINIRRTGETWKFTNFRDMANETTDTSAYYTGPFTGTNFGVLGANIAGAINDGVQTPGDVDMFTINGMSEVLNVAYLDLTKPWHEQGKFIDRYIAFRLICDNSDNNSVNLYSTESMFRKYNR
jgi:hypothetical protein